MENVQSLKNEDMVKVKGSSNWGVYTYCKFETNTVYTLLSPLKTAASDWKMVLMFLEKKGMLH